MGPSVVETSYLIMMRKFNLLALALVALFSFTCAAGERDADMPEYAGNPLTEEDFKRALTMFRDVVDDQESEASNGANLFEGHIVLPEGTSRRRPGRSSRVTPRSGQRTKTV